MKNILITSLVLFAVACNSIETKPSVNAISAGKDTLNYTTITWADPDQNIGELGLGDKAEIKFHFTNSGQKPLFIISVEPGCGCTVADFPKQAILPGKSGEIVAKYDTKKGYEGDFKKAVSVTTNTKPITVHNLTFGGVIKPVVKK